MEKKLTLDSALEKIKGLETELEGLNNAVKSLTISENINVVFENLLQTMQGILQYDDAFVLFEQNSGQYIAYYSTHFDFLERTWDSKGIFKKVEAGEAQIANNVSLTQEWNQHIDLTQIVKSALHFPLRGNSHKAIFICTSNQENFFTKEHLAIASHFTPFADYALKLLEINQALKEEIIERKKVEDENKRLQATVIDNAYKEGFAENAISVLHNIGNLTTPLKLKFEEANNIFQSEKIKQVIQKLVEIEDQSQRQMVVDKLNTVINNDNENIKELIKYGLDQTSKISTTITSQQKYANLKNKVKTKVDLLDIINDAIFTHTAQLEKYNIQKICQLMQKAEVTTERNGLHHVITNMITNAIEAINERSKIYGEFSDKYIYISLYEKDD